MANIQPTNSAANRQIPSTPEIKINVYDLIPPGRLASVLWTLGSSILHSGVVIDDREYAFGGHGEPGLTGIYWTKPGLLPPGGTFRCEIPMGYSHQTRDEIDRIIRQISAEFLGPSWNLLSNNCNHFTDLLCQRLTGKSTPYWLNRASTIGIALPCLIPQTWLSPPTAETVDGELVDEDVDDETAAILQRDASLVSTQDDDDRDYDYAGPSEDSDSDDIFDTRNRRRRRVYHDGSKARLVAHTDSSGRPIPVSERAPIKNNPK